MPDRLSSQVLSPPAMVSKMFTLQSPLFDGNQVQGHFSIEAHKASHIQCQYQEETKLAIVGGHTSLSNSMSLHEQLSKDHAQALAQRGMDNYFEIWTREVSGKQPMDDQGWSMLGKATKATHCVICKGGHDLSFELCREPKLRFTRS